jgi:hypothetical protein
MRSYVRYAIYGTRTCEGLCTTCAAIRPVAAVAANDRQSRQEHTPPRRAPGAWLLIELAVPSLIVLPRPRSPSPLSLPLPFENPLS